MSGTWSSPEELAREVVRLHGEDAILIVQPPGAVGRPEMRAMFQRVDALRREHGREYVIVDLRGAARPDAASRRALVEEGAIIRDLKHVAVFTGKNLLMNTVARFILSPIYDSYSVHKTQEQAEEAIRNAVDKG